MADASGACSDCDARCCEYHCSAENRQAETYGPWCSNRAGYKTDHFGAGPCFRHTGATPIQRRLGQRRLVEKRAAEKLSDWGYEPVTDPVAAMADLAGRAIGLLDAIGSSLADGTVTTGAIDALGVAMERAQRMAKDLASVGFEEQRVRLHRQTVELLGSAMRAAFAAQRDWVSLQLAEAVAAGRAVDAELVAQVWAAGESASLRRGIEPLAIEADASEVASGDGHGRRRDAT